MSHDVVNLSIEGSVTTVTLERRDRLNGIDGRVLEQLRSVCEQVEIAPAIRAIVLQGHGRGSCAGADLECIELIVTDAVAFDGFLKAWNSAFDRIENLPVLVIVSAYGVALAGGFEHTHVFDLFVLAYDTSIEDGRARHAMVPAGGGIHRLERIVGLRRARWLLRPAESIASALAFQRGVATEVVPARDVQRRAPEIAHLLAGRSSRLSVAMKSALNGHSHKAIATDSEPPMAASHMTSEDARVRFDAFRRRTEPVFPIQALRENP